MQLFINKDLILEDLIIIIFYIYGTNLVVGVWDGESEAEMRQQTTYGKCLFMIWLSYPLLLPIPTKTVS